MGGFYGAKLQKAGSEVYFLQPKILSTIFACGLVIESKNGDFYLPKGMLTPRDETYENMRKPFSTSQCGHPNDGFGQEFGRR
ncbi:MAG: 2-dehydropantoate 2-reductase N-terminal domain-containing protein [Cyanobacteria bacterium P01_D01_bin.116]